MRQFAIAWLAASLAANFFITASATCCTLCSGSQPNRLTLRQEVERSRVVILGTIGAAREAPDTPGGGTTDFRILRIIQGAELLPNQNLVVLPRFLSADPQSRKTWLLFGDVRNGRFDYLSSRTVPDEKIAEHVTAALELRSKSRNDALAFFANRLDHATPEIAADAFLELARASDAEVGNLARQLDAKRLRRLLAAKSTPGEQLGVLALLLAGCGTDADAAQLRGMLEDESDRTRSAYSGLLAGYVVLRPDAGWRLATDVIKDQKRAFLQRYAVIGTMRFLQGWRGADEQTRILAILREALRHTDLADVVVEDLRRWQWWDLTQPILAEAKLQKNDGPMFRRAVVRYALTCPAPAARQFIDAQRRLDPEFVTEMVESLRDERR